MKRFLALAIAVLMILSFAACASDKSGSDGSDTTAASDITAANKKASLIVKSCSLFLIYFLPHKQARGIL